jgi:pyrroline-5-carboxylate reductase
MTTISIIGSGNMATAIGTRAAKHRACRESRPRL